ncbi:MAG: hypothetical protein ABJZ74_03320, partial [Nitratireductor sp.]
GVPAKMLPGAGGRRAPARDHPPRPALPVAATQDGAGEPSVPAVEKTSTASIPRPKAGLGASREDAPRSIVDIILGR